MQDGDTTTTLGQIKEAVERFGAQRAWQPFHSPKNLVMALAVETSELMEHFLWIENDASRTLADDPAKRSEIADELADVFNVVLNLSLSLGVDLSEALRSKMLKNALKYPAP